MNSAPLVSIVIPAYNPRFFNGALQSALGQSHVSFEVVVCDDSRGSDIRSIFDAQLENPAINVRYVRNTDRLGLVGNLLACLDQARGEYVKFLCDDDLLFSACIHLQATALTENPDATLVLAQRLYLDADGMQLPSRLENSALAPTSAIFKGDDLLAVFERFPVNILGGFSNAMFRRTDLLDLLPALTQPDHCFVASLDFALYICLMRRGNIVVLQEVLSAERLYPERLSRQQPMKDAALKERNWLVEMLKARSGESAPAPGWVRYLPLNLASGSPRVWEELPLTRGLGTRQTTQIWRVGVESQSFSELYHEWLACRTLSAEERVLLPDTLDRWAWQPKIVPVVVDDGTDGASLMVTLKSLKAQLYPADLILVLSSACSETALDVNVLRMPLQDNWQQQLNEVLPQLQGADWVYLLRAGDRLTESALVVLAERIVAFADARCIYTDEGALLEGESARPAFKPDFNLDLLRSFPYVGRTLAFDREHLLAVGGVDPSFGELAPLDALWRLVEAYGTQSVEHISEVLVESWLGFSDWLALPEVVGQNSRVLHAHLERLGVAHEIRHGSMELLNRVDYLHAHRPLVSIIISSKDQLAALQRCVDSLLEKTAYSEYELLLCDNGSEQADTLTWLAAMAQLGSDRLRVLSYPQQGNPAGLYNFAAQHARGDYLLLLNPFAVVTQPDWLDELLNHGQRPEVAVVGAKLFNPDGLILHAGLILGLHGPAGVPFSGDATNSAGYMSRLQVAQNFSAVGGDCLLVRKQVFDEVGGLDEASLPGSLFEVDLCLRIGQAGYLVVWTPFAQLALGSRPVPVVVEEIEQQRAREQDTYYKRWLPVVAKDPAYNVNLSLTTLGGRSFHLEPGLTTGWSPFVRKQSPVVAAMPINASAVGHYRVTQPLIELQAAGRATGRIYYSTPSIIELERLDPEVIILQCRYSEGPIEEIVPMKKFSNARRIYELDDYVIHSTKKNSHARNKPVKEEMERLVRWGISLCDRVVVSTQPLADALSSMHHDIRVVPNMLAPNLWNNLHSKRRTSKKPRVGWGGGTSHQGDLEIIAEVVRELANEVEWVFFGMCPQELRPFIHEFHGTIDLDSYPAKLASLNLDLALAPLELHIFNHCKSNLRLLEYGACGYPVVCTDTQAYRGYLPCTRVISNSTEEWLQAIRMHLAEPEASYRMGDQLREAVLRDFMLRGDNLEHWVNGWFAD